MARQQRQWSVFAVAALMTAVALWGFVTAQSPAPRNPQSALMSQSQEEAQAKSSGCISCHGGIEKMHKTTAFHLACVDCHGGDGAALTQETAHVRARHPEAWPSSANPERSYTLLNRESPEFIRFVNPGDLRVADMACGPCHENEVLRVQKSMMTTSTLLWGGASYNNGIVSAKNYFFGESYGADGSPRKINTVPPPDSAEMARGVLPFVVPLPRWEITQVANLFRTFERGGKVSRANPSNIGLPDPFEEPGRPDNKLGARGLGTELRISSPVLNIQKTRLNDPHLSFLGTNDHPGDYRSSGCTGCHVIYANDRSPTHSGPYAQFGNRGMSQTADPTIPKDKPGHPIKHEFTTSIPTSQCMVCHMHQPNSFVNTYLGFQAWDYETDGETMYPQEQKYLSSKEAHKALSKNPEEAVLRGNWGDYEFLANVSDDNDLKPRTQFADYHGHGWLFRAVFKKDKQGNLLDKDGSIIPWNAPHKFHGVIPREGQAPSCGPGCEDAPKAVHLKDIHAERGMHCVDCHFTNDSHGDGNLYGEFHNATEIRCQDCHGNVLEPASLTTSGGARGGGLDLTSLSTPFGEKRFRTNRAKQVIQRSMISPELEWTVPQVVNSVNPGHPSFNEKCARAKTAAKGGGNWKPGQDPNSLAHGEKMECYSCHSSWVTNCFGCHLPQQANWQTAMKHFEGTKSRNWTTYNPQVVRDDAFMLGLHGTTKDHTIAPVRSSSALLLSSRNANREQVYLQQAPISTPGYSSQAFNPHFPHTVRTTETRECSDCHVNEDNTNNAWLAQVFLHGTNFVNFMGKYVYVAEGDHGVEAVQVTETDEPQAVIGSYLHKLAYPDWYADHLNAGRTLGTAYHHSSKAMRSLQLRGEYLYTADGPGGLRVFDVANIDNKGYSERIVTAPVSSWGQNTQVKSTNATAVALPTNMPIDTRRTQLPENQEQPWHPVYSYAFVTDSQEGLIVVDVMTLADGDPSNNFLERAATFNPEGILRGAVNLTVAGHFIYICCDAGLVVIDADDPLNPKVAAVASETLLPTSAAIQFRYAFVTDSEGLKTFDITDPYAPQFTGSALEIGEAHEVTVARTYAYVAAGQQGLAIVNAENPEAMALVQYFDAGGKLADTRAVRIASTNASLFAYVADGKNGLHVLQLTSPERVLGYLGFSPKPDPELIATYKTHGAAVSLSRAMERDRAVDETGHQVSVFGRLGSRPLNLEEQQRLYLRNGTVWRVSDGKKLP